jgi:geranylgeranyl diphosphate synthase type II
MREALRAAILESLPERHENPEIAHFYRLVRDYPEREGKYLRGLMLLLTAAACGADWRRALKVAAALELFQDWVLIHDDIEDGSEERRGQPSLHRLAGMPLALNAGDALHVYMWRVLHRLDGFSAAIHRQIVSEFETLISRTTTGQHLDLAWTSAGRFDVSEAEYLAMVTLKTAYYTAVGPLRLGALCAGRQPDARWDEAGKALGVAFQIRDDVLNLLPEVSYGKEFAGDLYEAKRTLILAHLFAHAEGAERAELKARLSKPRAQKTHTDIEVVLTLIHRYGALEYAQGVAEAKAQAGMELFAATRAELPVRDWALELTWLLESLVSRRR